jgi:glycosyltransferase involved in cell wall biosynthesis
MHVLIDARPIFHYPAIRGVAQTLVSLYTVMAQIRPEWAFTMVHQVDRREIRSTFPSNIKVHRLDGPGDRMDAWPNVWLPLYSLRCGADVLHCHGATGPRIPLVPLLTTIHDLTPLQFRADHPDADRWAGSVARAARAARRILTPSEFVRQEVHRVLSIPLDKITAVHWGRNEQYDIPIDTQQMTDVKMRHGIHLERPYVLHFGQTMTRKNTIGLMRAWAGLSEQRRGQATLEIVGLEAHGLDRFHEMGRELGIADSCRCRGFVSADDVAALLAGAAALAYVSLSEGFGLPVLDAFAAGTPVLASNTSCLPEIAGDAALLVDSRDVSAMTSALERLLSDASLREDLSAKGRRRALDFSWTKTAEAASALLLESSK